jgi:hypothetical protein
MIEPKNRQLKAPKNQRLKGSSALGSDRDHVDPPAAARAAHKPRVPFRERQLGAVAFGHLGWIGLSLVAAIETPNDEAHAR